MTIIAAIQMTSTENVEHNLLIAEYYLAKAVERNAKLIVLPEMFALMNSDKQAKIRHKETKGQGPIQTFLSDCAKKYNCWIVGGTLPLATEDPHKIHAACFVYNNQGEAVAHYNKIHLFDVAVIKGKEEYQESVTTQPGNKSVVIDTPVGKLGIAVCYDLRFPELFRLMLNQGAEIFAVPSAFTHITGQAHWEILTRARAIENVCYVVGACQVGIHPGGRKTYGHSMIINPWGEILSSLTFEPNIILAEINLDFLRETRARLPVKQHQVYFVNEHPKATL